MIQDRPDRVKQWRGNAQLTEAVAKSYHRRLTGGTSMRRSRLALVAPSILRDGPRGAGRGSIPHLGLAYVAGNVQRSATDLLAVDCAAERMTEADLLERLRAFRPDVVAFTAYTQSVKMVSRVATRLKADRPEIRVIVGGTHATAVPVETLDAYPSLDAAVVAEGERTFADLLEAYHRGGPDADVTAIPGVCGRREGRVVLAPPRPEIEELDAIGFPAWDLVDLDRYSGVYHVTDRARRAVPLATGRGCAFRCSFCFRGTGTTQRLRSIPNVLEELRHDVNVLGIREFVILNESFLADRNHVLEFCDALLREGLDRRVRWSCQSRVDQVTPEVAVALRRAGCRVVSLGIESGDAGMLDRMHKQTTLEQGIQAVRVAREAGLLTDTNFILGLPGETPESLARTIEHSLKVNADMAGFARLAPFPGTEVLRMARRGLGGLRLLSEDPDDFDKHTGAALELIRVPRAELDRFQRIAYWRFYRRPSRWLSALRMVRPLVLLVTAWQMLLGGLRSMVGAGRLRRGRPVPSRNPEALRPVSMPRAASPGP
jgi:radical SAM superfamily enzyme YgiQ (UPF0313 family)